MRVVVLFWHIYVGTTIMTHHDGPNGPNGTMDSLEAGSIISWTGLDILSKGGIRGHQMCIFLVYFFSLVIWAHPPHLLRYLRLSYRLVLAVGYFR